MFFKLPVNQHMALEHIVIGAGHDGQAMFAWRPAMSLHPDTGCSMRRIETVEQAVQRRRTDWQEVTAIAVEQEVAAQHLDRVTASRTRQWQVFKLKAVAEGVSREVKGGHAAF